MPKHRALEVREVKALTLEKVAEIDAKLEELNRAEKNS